MKNNQREIARRPENTIFLNLHKNNTLLIDGLKSLCSKGPSFVAVPSHYIWLQLQKDFDRFRNKLRNTVFFANKEENSNNNFRNNNEVNNPLKKKSNWSAPKSSLPEFETFLTLLKIYSALPNQVMSKIIFLTKKEAL